MESTVKLTFDFIPQLSHGGPVIKGYYPEPIQRAHNLLSLVQGLHNHSSRHGRKWEDQREPDSAGNDNVK